MDDIGLKCFWWSHFLKKFLSNANVVLLWIFGVESALISTISRIVSVLHRFSWIRMSPKPVSGANLVWHTSIHITVMFFKFDQDPVVENIHVDQFSVFSMSTCDTNVETVSVLNDDFAIAFLQQLGWLHIENRIVFVVPWYLQLTWINITRELLFSAEAHVLKYIEVN